MVGDWLVLLFFPALLTIVGLLVSSELKEVGEVDGSESRDLDGDMLCTICSKNQEMRIRYKFRTIGFIHHHFIY